MGCSSSNTSGMKRGVSAIHSFAKLFEFRSSTSLALTCRSPCRDRCAISLFMGHAYRRLITRRSFARGKSGQTPISSQSPAPSSTMIFLLIGKVALGTGKISNGGALRMYTVRATSASTQISAPVTSYKAIWVTATLLQHFPLWPSTPNVFRGSSSPSSRILRAVTPSPCTSTEKSAPSSSTINSPLILPRTNMPFVDHLRMVTTRYGL